MCFLKIPQATLTGPLPISNATVIRDQNEDGTSSVDIPCCNNWPLDEGVPRPRFIPTESAHPNIIYFQHEEKNNIFYNLFHNLYEHIIHW
jgi:hypothetical protein